MVTPNSEPLSLDERSREIFKRIVECFLETGEPLGSRNLSRTLPMTLSPASVRNVMSDLEDLGLIYSPHVSAGRIPTDTGLRLFVEGLLQVGELSSEERRKIEGQIAASRETTMESVLSEAGEMISGLSQCAGVVLTDKKTVRLKQIDFVQIEKDKALVVLVGEDQSVENRIIDLPKGLPMSALVEAANYLNAHISGLTIFEAKQRIERELKSAKAELDTLAAKFIEKGLASWSGALDERKSLIVRGQSNLLAEVNATEDLKRIQGLFEYLETKEELVQLLGLTESAMGVNIFIGSENELFSVSGSSMIVAPFHDTDRKIVGVLGVIGPTRLNYARIIPLVDYTAKLVGRVLT